MEERGKTAQKVGRNHESPSVPHWSSTHSWQRRNVNELQGKRPQEVQRELQDVKDTPLVLDRDASTPRGPGPHKHLKVLLDETDLFESLIDAVTVVRNLASQSCHRCKSVDGIMLIRTDLRCESPHSIRDAVLFRTIHVRLGR